jgi:hypothetical protein
MHTLKRNSSIALALVSACLALAITSLARQRLRSMAFDGFAALPCSSWLYDA